MEALFQKRFLRHFRIDFPIKYFSLLLKLPQSFDIRSFYNSIGVFTIGRSFIQSFHRLIV